MARLPVLSVRKYRAEKNSLEVKSASYAKLDNKR